MVIAAPIARWFGYPYPILKLILGKIICGAFRSGNRDVKSMCLHRRKACENRYCLVFCIPNTLVIALQSPQSANILDGFIGAQVVNYPQSWSAQLSKWRAF